jgi:hypothetical protein
MSDVAEAIKEAVEKAEEGGWLNSAAALTVAIVATFMAICNVKDDNITQAMAAAQAAGIDQWSYFQAKSTKQNIAEMAADQLEVERDLLVPGTPAAEQRPAIEKHIANYRAKAARYEVEKTEIKKQAEFQQKEYDRLNRRDDQFDMADAGSSIALALIGIAVLSKKKWLFAFALVFAAFGVLLGIAGFVGLDLHPDLLAKLLS